MSRAFLTNQITLRAATGFLLAGCASPTTTQATAEKPPSGSAATEILPATTESRGHTRAVTAREMQAIEELMQAAQQIRGLRFAHAVPVLVKDPDAIMAYIDTQIDADELQRAKTIYVTLGLLPAELDVRSLLLRLMGEQIVGYYDVEKGTLIVREDIMRAFGGARTQAPVDLAEARVVLVHELVHALQDQRLALSTRMDETRDSDADNAFRALIEGDATLAMIGFALERESVPLATLTTDPARVTGLSELVRSSPLAGSELDSAPPIVRVPLLSAYVDGLMFAANLHGDGGFARVNRTHTDPPLSTEQILHPERYVRRDAPDTLRMRDAKSLLGADYALVHEDTLGELEMRIYFSQTSSEPLASKAAEGWGGDRLLAYQSSAGQTAIVWLTTWDSTRDADEAQAAAERVQTEAPTTSFVMRTERSMLITRNVPRDLHAELRKRFLAWTQNRAPKATVAKSN